VRIARVCVAASLAGCLCLAGDLCGIPKRFPGVAAASAFEKIGEAVGFQQGTILLFVSSDQKVKDRSGAASDECVSGNGTERWIVYDPELIKSDLGRDFALAHETAHHMNHDLLSGEIPSKRQELDADKFAAEYLTRPPLNWTSDKLRQALSDLPLPKEAIGGYPTLEERRTQVIDGYQYESARYAPPPKVPVEAPRPAPRVDFCVGKLSQRAWYASQPVAPGELLAFNVTQCGGVAPSEDLPTDFGRDINGMCAVGPVAVGTRLTWSNIGVCALMRR
jgi:hypothetical protein